VTALSKGVSGGSVMSEVSHMRAALVWPRLSRALCARRYSHCLAAGTPPAVTRDARRLRVAGDSKSVEVDGTGGGREGCFWCVLFQ